MYFRFTIMKNFPLYVIATLALLLQNTVVAQEHTKGLMHNLEIINACPNVQHRVRALILPFVDDFSNTQIVPDINKWVDATAYINNTFSQEPITKGVATLDALTAQGISYYPTGSLPKYYADSLTSQSIDLNGLTPADSVYLSFYFQPQGLGFSPELGDSLMLYLKTNTGAWIKSWSSPGSVSQNWKQIMIPITATNYLHNDFQFRFVNIASPGINDDVWNLDYVRLAANRNRYDTVLNDVAFTSAPSSIFANHTAMPVRHFLPFPQEQSGNFSAYLGNRKNANTNIFSYLRAQQQPTNAIVKVDSTAVVLTPFLSEIADYNFYNLASVTNGADQIIHTYFIKASANATDIKTNDTIRSAYAMKNYFAYDDGSAEKAYYLYAAPNTAANTAIQFHLNIADSVQGLAIRFGSQIPSAAGKVFSVVLYKTLGASSASQQVLYQQDFNTVQYTNDREGFSYYKFNNAQYLDSGTYYIGVMQPANSGSDTIYFGLDVNNNYNASRLFYNVDGSWQPSGAIGSIMFRPLVGSTFTPTAIKHHSIINRNCTVYPNPTNDNINIISSTPHDAILITDVFGKIISYTKTHSNTLSVSQLQAGLYTIQLMHKNVLYDKVNFIKK